MNRDQKSFHTILDKVAGLDYAPGESEEATWAECLALVHEAGDKATRLGLPQIATKARRFRLGTTPGKAKVFLAECLSALAAVSPASTADEMLTLPEAAKILGYTEKGLRNIVERSKRALAGQRVNGPTVEFAQAGVRGAIRFRREWIENFIAGHRPTPMKATKGAAVRAKASHGLRFELLGR